ncbi:MAG: GlsB/YeaQ/YmgE family stress response membrane protein [Miltoncostaeaceae bacterium]
MGILTWVLFGLVAGALARLATPGKGPSGCIPTVLIGVVGALIGGFIATGLGAEDGVTGFNVWSFAVAVGGAVLLLILYRAIRRK